MKKAVAKAAAFLFWVRAFSGSIFASDEDLKRRHHYVIPDYYGRNAWPPDQAAQATFEECRTAASWVSETI
ncbi:MULTISPECIES: hypothetical protein [Agrobacterium tumefaciens complex]|uniref:hypothetical protein n=1 Tax=Agrobacterium tumefaciens complex TaxID=1183400 RepID=UPI001CD9EB21|nr:MULTISPECIES: hypothetical protein [Agrobacterium tumefaciens complex]